MSRALIALCSSSLRNGNVAPRPFLSAPFTSLTPVVGTGYVTAFVQAWVRPPRVFELRELKADALVPRRWFRNRALKIALALILPTIGSIFGTFVGGSRLISGALGG